MKTRLNCPCGFSIKAADEDDLIKQTQEHLAANHPDHDYTPDEILFIAY